MQLVVSNVTLDAHESTKMRLSECVRNNLLMGFWVQTWTGVCLPFEGLRKRITEPDEAHVQSQEQVTAAPRDFCQITTSCCGMSSLA